MVDEIPGIAIDVRKDSPYAAYPDLEFKSITHDGCCIHSRTMVRLDEIFESFKLIRQCCERMPKAPLRAHAPDPHGRSLRPQRSAPRRSLLLHPYQRHGHPGPPQVARASYMNWEALGVMMRDCAVADVA